MVLFTCVLFRSISLGAKNISGYKSSGLTHVFSRVLLPMLVKGYIELLLEKHVPEA
jgi:hypothetical protein